MTPTRSWLVVLVAVLLAACSTGSEPRDGTGAIGSGEPGDVSELVSRTMTTPHRYEVFWDVPAPNGEIDLERPIQSGAFDGTWLSVDVLLPLVPEAGSGPAMQSITGGDVGYFALPGLRDVDEFSRWQLLDGNPFEPAVDSWVVMNVAEVRDRVAVDPLTLTPQMTDVAEELTELLAKAIDIEEGPASTVRGVDTRTFEAVVPADEDASDLFPAEDSAVSFRVDAQGYLRSLTQDSMFGRTHIEIFDIGAPITITLPESAIDITASAIEVLGQQLDQRATSGPGESDAATPDSATLLELIARQPELSTFLTLLGDAGLADLLQRNGEAQFTVLAPTNDALANMGEGLTRIRRDDAQLVEFVSNHLIRGRYSLAELEARETITTESGAVQHLSVRSYRLTIGDAASIVTGDLVGANGVIHIVDRPIR